MPAFKVSVARRIERLHDQALYSRLAFAEFRYGVLRSVTREGGIQKERLLG